MWHVIQSGPASGCYVISPFEFLVVQLQVRKLNQSVSLIPFFVSPGTKNCNYQVLPRDPFGSFKWPLQGLSDLHLGDRRVTWKKLVFIRNFVCWYLNSCKTLECTQKPLQNQTEEMTNLNDWRFWTSKKHLLHHLGSCSRLTLAAVGLIEVWKWSNTVDGWNLAPPGMHKNMYIMG